MGTLQYSKVQVLDMLNKKVAAKMLNSCALIHWHNQYIPFKNNKRLILDKKYIEKISALFDKEGTIKGYNVIISYPEKKSYYVKSDKVLHEFRANVETFRKETIEKIDTLFADLENKLNVALKNRDVGLNGFYDYRYRIERLASARLLQIYSLDEFVVDRIIRDKENDKIEILKVLDAKSLQEKYHAAVTNMDIACYIKLCEINDNLSAEMDSKLNENVNYIYQVHDKKIAALTQWW